MKACVLRGVRDLMLTDLPEPVPGTGEVLVRLGAGGICGSDLHYFAEGGAGDFRLREPMTLGHEGAGEVVKVGAEVRNVKPGDRVAVNPNHPCDHCRPCQAGRRNLCSNVRFFGSAARLPHVQGLFAELFVAAAEIVFPCRNGSPRARRPAPSRSPSPCTRPRRRVRCRANRCSSPDPGRSACSWPPPRAAPGPRGSASPTCSTSRW